jgi:hypothetical protein
VLDTTIDAVAVLYTPIDAALRSSDVGAAKVWWQQQ